MALEDHFFKIAMSSQKRCVIICDRGIMDGSAYCDDNIW